jgi:hypothetical protein
MTDPRVEVQRPGDDAAAEPAGAGSDRRRRPRRKPRAWPTVAAALAIFGVAFEFLAFQLQAGHDPAIGAAASTPAKTRPARKLVITKVIPAPGSAGSAVAASSVSGSVAAPAPVTTATS